VKIPIFILSGLVCVAIAVEAWTLTEVIALKVEVATLRERVNSRFGIAEVKKHE
jgi:hypothetical protein